MSTITHDPPDTTAAAAAYALITTPPRFGHGAVITMAPLPDSALTRQAVHERLSLICARCELMLLENVDRMAVRGLLTDQDLKKFNLVMQFLSRLMSVRKSLDAYQKNAPDAPTSTALESDLNSALSDYLEAQTPSSAPPADQSPTDPQISSISNLKSQISNSAPPSPISQPTTHISHPSSPIPQSEIPNPPSSPVHNVHAVHPVHAVHACPTLPLEAIEPALTKIASALSSPSPLSSPDDPRAKEKAIARYLAKRPDPKNTPTSFYPYPYGPGTPYQPAVCPECAQCCTGYCVQRSIMPDFVTCDRACVACAYTADCPWTPHRFRLDPG